MVYAAVSSLQCSLDCLLRGWVQFLLERGGSAASQGIAEVGCSWCQRGAVLVASTIITGLARAARALKKVDQLHLCAHKLGVAFNQVPQNAIGTRQAADLAQFHGVCCTDLSGRIRCLTACDTTDKEPI